MWSLHLSHRIFHYSKVLWSPAPLGHKTMDVLWSRNSHGVLRLRAAVACSSTGQSLGHAAPGRENFMRRVREHAGPFSCTIGRSSRPRSSSVFACSKSSLWGADGQKIQQMITDRTRAGLGWVDVDACLTRASRVFFFFWAGKIGVREVDVGGEGQEKATLAGFASFVDMLGYLVDGLSQ